MPVRSTGAVPATAANAVLERLNTDGFVMVEAITDEDDIAMIRQQMDEAIALKKGEKEHWVRDLGDTKIITAKADILEIIHLSRLMPALTQSRFYANAKRVSQQMLGPKAEYLFDHCIIKPGLSMTETAWHQDDAYTGRFFSRTGDARVHWWLPLQPVDLDNSCMQFVPGSHRWPLLPHRLRSPTAHAKQVDLPAGATPTACPLPLGNATIHTTKTLHYTGPNHSTAPRYAWVLQFGIRYRVPRIKRFF